MVGPPDPDEADDGNDDGDEEVGETEPPLAEFAGFIGGDHV